MGISEDEDLNAGLRKQGYAGEEAYVSPTRRNTVDGHRGISHDSQDTDLKLCLDIFCQTAQRGRWKEKLPAVLRIGVLLPTWLPHHSGGDAIGPAAVPMVMEVEDNKGKENRLMRDHHIPTSGCCALNHVERGHHCSGNPVDRHAHRAGNDVIHSLRAPGNPDVRLDTFNHPARRERSCLGLGWRDVRGGETWKAILPAHGPALTSFRNQPDSAVQHVGTESRYRCGLGRGT